jgi:hypothetical protein
MFKFFFTEGSSGTEQVQNVTGVGKLEGTISMLGM